MTSTEALDMSATVLISRLIHREFDRIVAPALASLWNSTPPNQSNTQCKQFQETEQWLRSHVQNNCETSHCHDAFKTNGVPHPYADDLVQYGYDRIDFTELTKIVLESWETAYFT